MKIMKHKILVLILALTVASWAQTTTQTAPADPPQNAAPAEKSKCACCDKMASADGKYSHANCMRHDEDETSAKDMSSCCGGKDAKSSMKGDKIAVSCCKDTCEKDKTASMGCGKDCGNKCEKGCCSSEKRTAKNCCRKEIRG